MNKILFLLFLIFCFTSLTQKNTDSLDKLIDGWHLAATNADFKAYFDPTANGFIFLGTAPGERWTKKEFQDFSKPYFDKGKAWDFKASNRKWNFSKDRKTAWFDEDLKTWMEDCRGSGVCVKEKGEWKLAYYNLTVLIENEKIKEFIQLRKQ
jgi:hypothetical protein